MIKQTTEGQQAELLCAYQFNGRLTAELEHQYKDIDLFIKDKAGDWKSCSVKDQLRGTSRGWTSVQIELEQFDIDTDETMPGCFYKTQADFYFWRVEWQGSAYWCVVPTIALQAYVEAHREVLTEWTTTYATGVRNRSQGRKYNMACGVEVELAELGKLGKWIPVKSLAPTEATE